MPISLSTVKRNAILALVFQVLGISIGCKTYKATSDVKFGIYGNAMAATLKEKSLLSILQRTGGKLDVLVLFADRDKWVNGSKNEVDAAAAQFKKAVETWIAPLQGYEGWNLRQVTLNVRTMAVDANQTSVNPCQFSLSTNFYNCTDSSSEMRLIVAKQEPFRAHATFISGFLAVSAKNDPKVYVHETGHLMGMADIYEEWGYQKMGEQHDKSIMHTPNEVDTLTGDDIAGIKQIWRFIKSGKMECPTGYRVGTLESDRSDYSKNTVLCVREGTPRRQFCSAKAIQDPLHHGWGAEPDGTSCYIGPSPARGYPMCSFSASVNTAGWGMENGQSCWRPVIPFCSEQARLIAYLPQAGIIGGLEGRNPCLVMACTSQSKGDASGTTNIGQPCKDPKGLQVQAAKEDVPNDGYPLCSKYAVVHKDDPSWGYEPNKVSCHNRKQEFENTSR